MTANNIKSLNPDWDKCIKRDANYLLNFHSGADIIDVIVNSEFFL